ncbi:acyltransferase family protein [Streptomyces alkaliphilus]|uniref:Acyltransferase family protein n=1 Tax=Streptomyces alkaliphilus TaxID=1472722 RepID=A0A7W3T9Q6_9ACTN|nr:acyltransferase family protein [Streptomyces alkaliphilus]
MRGLREAAERTPPQRERYVDLLRAVAITMVVLGHWLVVNVTYDGAGDLDGYSALGELTWSHPVTWVFQVMPLFFLVGGYANGASWDSHRRRGVDTAGWLLTRGNRLLIPTTVLIVLAAVAAPVARLAGAAEDVTETAVWLVAIPLWFLTAYLTVVVLTPILHPLHRRAGWTVVAVLVCAVAVTDAAELWLGVPHVTLVNYLLVWLAVHQVGFAWRDGMLDDRRVAAGLAGGGLVALVLLTVPGPYPISMVTVPGEEAQNTAPPTLALLALAACWIGGAILLRNRAARWLAGFRPWLVVVAVNSVVLTVFLWHMAAVVIAAVVLYPPGLMPQPPVDSTDWLLWRVPWLVCLSVVLAVLVLVFGGVERRARRVGALPARTGDGDTGERASGSGVVSTVATCLALAAAIAGLLGITTAGATGEGPVGIPGWALALYLVGAGRLWIVALVRSR